MEVREKEEGRERGAVTRKRSQSVCVAASAGESRIATCAVQICCWGSYSLCPLLRPLSGPPRTRHTHTHALTIATTHPKPSCGDVAAVRAPN